MNRSEVIELFKLLKDVYPTFEVSTPKVNTWTKLTKDMDNDRVLKKAEQHIAENKFPPTIAEIAAYAPEKNESLAKFNQWKKEAEKVSASKKAEFKRKMQELVKEKKL